MFQRFDEAVENAKDPLMEGIVCKAISHELDYSLNKADNNVRFYMREIILENDGQGMSKVEFKRRKIRAISLLLFTKVFSYAKSLLSKLMPKEDTQVPKFLNFLLCDLLSSAAALGTGINTELSKKSWLLILLPQRLSLRTILWTSTN